MRSAMMTALLVLTLTAAAHAADAAKPKATAKGKAKPQAMSTEKRQDLERRIEALERKNEMGYRETDAPNGAPGANAPAEKPAAH